MSRYVSFGVLLAVIALLSILFYKILAGFLVPLFLAALLVVVFRPLHDHVITWCRGREKMAAFLTTLSILLVVLIPMGILLTLATFEGREALGGGNFEVTTIKSKIRTLRENIGFDLPIATEIRGIESEFAEISEQSSFEDLEYHQEKWFGINEYGKSISSYLNRQSKALESASARIDSDDQNAMEKLTGRRKKLELAVERWDKFNESCDVTSTLGHETKLLSFQTGLEEDAKDRNQELAKYHKLCEETSDLFNDFKNEFSGGRTMSKLKMILNPDSDQVAMHFASVADYFQGKLLTLGGAAAKLVVGLFIMIISLYFFLLDGPNMIESVQGLSPLDDEHEKELVVEFGRVSRAVVVATLLSALVQGLLAGVGFYFCGFQSIFLLTMLTTGLALVPFVGAASVWIPASLYLFFIDGNIGAAIGLAIYGAVIISMADNVIKPFVLHGQSNLHPLLALLSVLGGVTALGPIGLLVGPMVVAFLQTLLKILQRELLSMETPVARVSTTTGNTTQPVSENVAPKVE